MAASPPAVLATVSVEVLRPGEVTTTGVLGDDGFVEIALFDDPPARIAALQFANAIAKALHVGPRPRVALPELLHGSREALDLLLDDDSAHGVALSLGFGLDLAPAAAAALRALGSGAVLHWRVRIAWGADRSRTCEIVDGGHNGAWRVVELAEDLGGGILLGPVDATEIWRRLSTIVPGEDEL